MAVPVRFWHNYGLATLYYELFVGWRYCVVFPAILAREFPAQCTDACEIIAEASQHNGDCRSKLHLVSGSSNARVLHVLRGKLCCFICCTALMAICSRHP